MKYPHSHFTFKFTLLAAFMLIMLSSCMPFTQIGTAEPTQENIEMHQKRDQAAIIQAQSILYRRYYGAWYPLEVNNELTKKVDPFKETAIIRGRTHRYQTDQGPYAVDVSAIQMRNPSYYIDGLEVVLYTNSQRYYNPNDIIIKGFRDNPSIIVSHEPTHSRSASSSKVTFRVMDARSLANAESDTLKGRIYTDAFYADFDFPRSIITEFYEQMEAGAWTLID